MPLDVGKISATAFLNTAEFQKSISKTQQEADKLSSTLKSKLHGDIKIDNKDALNNIKSTNLAVNSLKSQVHGKITVDNANALHNIKNTDSAVNSLSTSFSRVEIAAISAAAAIVAAVTYKTINKMIELTAEIQKLATQYRYIAGDAGLAADQFAFVRDVSDDLGLDIYSVAESFAKFSAAAKSSEISMQDTKNLFIGLSEAVTTLGLSAPQAALAFKAVEQIASKGIVSMEELRGQLGEQLPGAFGLAAKSIGMTTKELNEFMSKNSIAANEFLPQFAQTLHNEFSKAAIDASNNINAMTNRISQSFFDLKLIAVSIFKTPVLEPLVAGVAESFKSITNFVKLIAPEISSILKTISPLFNVIGFVFSALAKALQAATFLITKSIRIIITLIADAGIAIKKGFASYISYATDGMQKLSAALSKRLGIGEDLSIFLYEINEDVKKWSQSVDKIEYDPIEIVLDPLEIDEVFTKFNADAAKFIDIAAKKIEDNDKIKKAIKKAIIPSIKSSDLLDIAKEIENIEDTIGTKVKKIKIPPIETIELTKSLSIIESAGIQSIDSFSEALSTMATTGEVSFKDMTNSILADLTKLIIKMTIVEPLINSFQASITRSNTSGGGFFSSILSGIGAFLGVTASGTAGIEAGAGSAAYNFFANGGVINEPVLGIGQRTGESYMIGEKGPETIIPNSQISRLAQPKMSTQAGDTVVNNAQQNKTETIQNVNLSINAVDANSFVSLAQKNPQAIIGPFLSALRLGDKSLVRGIQTAVGGM